jgi:SAM-dependent methyltransferase
MANPRIETHQSWDDPRHLGAFSDYVHDLPLFQRYRNSQIYGNIRKCLELVLPCSSTVVEIGVGGGRSYAFLREISKRLENIDYQYTGYDISRQCVEFCKARYAENFICSETEVFKYQVADLVFFFDVMVHCRSPLDFLTQASTASRRYLCFQTPTRDKGPTEYNVEKSCRLENGSWVPWIVFNTTELAEELKARGFCKVLLLKEYKSFAGNAPRFLPKEFFEMDIGSASSAVLAIRPEGLNNSIESSNLLAHDINEMIVKERSKIPIAVQLMNSIFRNIKGR